MKKRQPADELLKERRTPSKRPRKCPCCGSTEVFYCGAITVGSVIRPAWACYDCNQWSHGKKTKRRKHRYCNKRQGYSYSFYHSDLKYKHVQFLDLLVLIREQVKAGKKPSLLRTLHKALSAYFAELEAKEREEVERAEADKQLRNFVLAGLTVTEMYRVMFYRQNPLLPEKQLAAKCGISLGAWKAEMASARRKMGVSSSTDLLKKTDIPPEVLTIDPEVTAHEELIQASFETMKRSPKPSRPKPLSL